MLDQVKAIIGFPLLTLGEQVITIGHIVLAPLGLLCGLWLAKFFIKKLTKRLKEQGKDPNLVLLIERLLYMVVIAILFFTTLSLLQVPITAFAFLSGAIAIGVGFGAQNVINNFISGWMLIGEKPIRIGDFLEVEGVKGVVEEINTRSTRVRRVDGVHMLIPNSKLLENTVTNWTLRDKLVRGTVSVGVAYGSDCDQVAQIILDVTKAHKEVLQTPATDVFFQDFGDNALIFEVYYWINSQVEGGLRKVSSDIRFALSRAFHQQGIVVAYPQRDVHIDGKISIERPLRQSANQDSD